MKKILSLLSLLMLCVVGVNAEKVIYSWPSDASQANSITLAEGVTVTITGNSEKKIQNGNKITIGGTEYTSMKVSNGAQNTLTLPKEAVGITFYSYVNKDAATDRVPYWKEVAGVEYTEETSGGTMTSYKNGANPDVRSFSFEKTKEVTFTNTGEQLCYVMEVEYAEEGSEVPVVNNKTIGLIPGVWDVDGATFAAYAFNSDTENAWFPFAAVEGAYATQIPDNYTGINIVRLKPATAEGFSTENYGLNWTNKWNQTDDIDFTAIADKTVFTITGYVEGGNSTYTTGSVPADLTELKATLQKVVNLAKMFGYDTTQAEALIASDEATAEQLTAALQALATGAKDKASEALSQAKAFFEKFDATASANLAPYFNAAEAALAGTDIDAMLTAAQTLTNKIIEEGQSAIGKVDSYLRKMENETVNKDLDDILAALQTGNLQNVMSTLQQLKADITDAATTYLAVVSKMISDGAAAGKDVSKMQTAYNNILTVAVDYKNGTATLVEMGVALYNLIKAVENYKEVNTTYTIAGTKDLTGTEEAWQVVEANNMTLVDGLYTWTAENITVTAETQPQFKVVITNIDGKQTWIPASEEGNDHNWIITPYVVGGEGVYTITITYNAKTQEINVINKEWAETIAAAEALVDENAVAVGKLLAAIETAKAASGTTADKEALQAAINQFKADNAPLEADVTSQFPVDYQGWSGATGFVGWAAPTVTTNDGRTTAACERYEGTCANTGDVFTRTLTGLTNGTYRIELYGAAAFTSGRGFDSELVEGDETAVYLYAETVAGTVKQYIPAHVADNFNGTGIETAVLDGVVISDGTVKLGMYKDKAYTNWHVVQIKGVTALALAKDLYATCQAELTELVEEGQALAADEYKTVGKEEFSEVLAVAEEATTDKKNWYNVPEAQQIVADLKAAIANFKKANWFINFAAGEYYIIEAESGLKMAAGNDYGTRGIVNEMGLDLTLTPYEESRTVTIDSRVSNGGNNHFLSSNLYMDSSEWGWALEYRGFGFYILEPVSGKYINVSLTGNNLELSETPCEWIIVSKEGVIAQHMEEMAEATENNPVDATFLLQNPNFNRNDQRVAAWTVSDDCTNKNLNGGNQVNNCAESYHSTFTIMQTISGAPAGLYKMTAQGFYRQDEYQGDAPAAPVFFANGVNGDVPVLAEGGPNGMDTASEAFTNGDYTIDPINFEVKEDGMMYIGITQPETNTQWVIWDNFRLTYFGKDDTTTGITTVNTSVNQNGTIYNLNGQKVTNAQKGLFIINGKKMVVR